MPSKYWEDSADLSRDSSAESTQDSVELPGPSTASPAKDSLFNLDPFETSQHQRKRPPDSRTDSIEEVDRTVPPDGTVSKALATTFHLPTLEPHQHASLFYLSLIEGRCRLQALSSINSTRCASEHVTEDHPEVGALAQHLFSEMSKELAKAGMLPEEFVGRPLPELRLYLNSFDSILTGITSRPSELPVFNGQDSIASEPGSRGDQNSLVRSSSTAGVPKVGSTSDGNIPFPSPGSNYPTWLGRANSSGGQSGQRGPLERQNSISYIKSSSDVFERSQGIGSVRNLQASAFDDYSQESQSGGTSITDSSFGYENMIASQALVRQNFAGIGVAQHAFSRGSPFSFTDPVYLRDAMPKSVFATEYQTTATLGKGGFGKVLQVTSHIDKAEYAVKRIKYPAAKVRQLAQTGQMQELLNEVQALARYNHQHVVRYFHAWVETRPVEHLEEELWSVGDENDGGGGDLSAQKQALSSVDTASVDMSNLALQNQQALDDAFRSQQQNAAAFALNTNHVVFEPDLSPQPTPSRSFFRSALEPDSPSDSEGDGTGIKTISDDGSTSTISLSRHQSNEQALMRHGSQAIVPSFTDCFIYIKMTSYPLTLADFIYPPERSLGVSNSSSALPNHCFHPLPAIRLLLRILSGLAYLHRKDQIHRDLKPANIFLLILEDGEPPDKAWVDVHDCVECSPAGRKKLPCNVSPCIGDFGLVVDLKALDDNIPITTSNPDEQHSSDNINHSSNAESAFNQLPKTPGTKLYIPPNQSSHNIICPKLDTYALGIILFELIYKFDTKSERMIVLDRARQCIWPADFEENILAKGIKGMMELDREKRWSCEGVRMWAEGVEAELLSQAASVGETTGNGKLSSTDVVPVEEK